MAVTSEIARLHALYLSGERSPVDVVDLHLGLAADLGRRLNAFTCVTQDLARAEAMASAQRYARGEARSVLDGVPLTVKDNMHLEGLATTCSSGAADPTPARADAEAVARLRRLGAIIIGKTNLLEYAFGIVHPDYGPAHNPWDPERTASGSSSGSAVAVAAGIGFGSLGTDTAGSVRWPAAFCGTVGLKPSYGALSVAGVVPLSPSLDHVGVLTRTVEDARILFDAMHGRRASNVGNRPLRLGVVDPGPVSPDVHEAVVAAQDRLRADGVELVRVAPVPWREAHAAAFVIIAAEALEVHAGRLGERWHLYSRAMRTRLLGGAAVSGADYVRARRLREGLRARWQQALREDAVDAVLGPTLPCTAPVEGDTEATYLKGAGGFTSAYALLGIPAVTVPVAFDEQGLPIGLQVAACDGEDGIALDVAGRIENERGPWPLPPCVQETAASW